MYRFYINCIDNDYHYNELIRVFIPDENFEVIPVDINDSGNIKLRSKSIIVNQARSNDRDTIKKELYFLLKDICKAESDWGTITGVRPLKIALNIFDNNHSISETEQVLHDKFVVSDNKVKLLSRIIDYQKTFVKAKPNGKLGVYIGIPFCPTRCSYCSFASNVASESEIEIYLHNLLKEIAYMGMLFDKNNAEIESIYIGGGTPTTLSKDQLELLINCIDDKFHINPKDIEFTVEAGRPDTITADKLETLQNLGINRISINPQSMKDHTLELIGRKHTSEDIENAFALAKKYSFEIINADVIAGLPEETLEDFKETLDEVIKLGANNITVHTLSIKKGSRMKDDDPEFYRKNVETVDKMLKYSQQRLMDEGFYPYYIYKQKHQIGFFENVGYCKPNTHSIYNIRIMEEKQTIVGLGAGAIGKVYFPEEDRLERVPNVSNYQVYNEKFDEMLDRKNNYYGGSNEN